MTLQARTAIAWTGWRKSFFKVIIVSYWIPLNSIFASRFSTKEVDEHFQEIDSIIADVIPTELKSVYINVWIWY